MILYIQNMVSYCCKKMVKTELAKLNLSYTCIDLGEVELKEPISENDREELKKTLKKTGLFLMDDKNAILLERIKNVIIEMVHYSDEFPEENHSDYISSKLEMDYAQISSIFSQTKGMTIEQYIILNKVEKIKEYLLYNELSLKEIAYKLDYSSPSHLSNQFKKITGLTPIFFKTMKNHRRIAIEDL